MVACPEAEIANEEDYFQPIVSVMEVELALNDNQSWMGKYVSDFREFLCGRCLRADTYAHCYNRYHFLTTVHVFRVKIIIRFRK